MKTTIPFLILASSFSVGCNDTKQQDEDAFENARFNTQFVMDSQIKQTHQIQSSKVEMEKSYATKIIEGMITKYDLDRSLTSDFDILLRKLECKPMGAVIGAAQSEDFEKIDIRVGTVIESQLNHKSTRANK